MTNGLNKSLEVGMVLNDKWVILEFIAEGGMGEVYRAHQINLKRDVAVKVISREWLESCSDNEEERETGLQRFRNEVQAMAQIRHPNVLQIFDYGSASVSIGGEDVSLEYIVMEYVPGGTLRSTMSEEGFDSEEELIIEWLRHYFFPVLDGVQAMHDLKMAHRDLKPGNVLMDGNTPKIADFGLAHSHQWKPVTQSMDIKGTPQYMSQEHFFEFKKADHRSDIYSIGKILYESIAGRINSKTIPFKKAALSNPDTPFLKKLDQIIQDATAEDKEKRLDSVEKLHKSLLEAIESVESETTSDGTAIPRQFPVLYQPRFIWAGIVIAVVSVALMGLWHLIGEPGKTTAPLEPTQTTRMESSQTAPSVPSKAELISPASPARSVMGKDGITMLFIPGGEFKANTEGLNRQGQTFQVQSFYLDEKMVSNHHFNEFLNEEKDRLNVENAVVKHNDEIWFYLGKGTEPHEQIIYEHGRFHLRDIEYAAHPVVRVTWYGAMAYARHYDKRLSTEYEWNYTVLDNSFRGKVLSSNKTYTPPSSTEEASGRAETNTNMMHMMQMDSHMMQMDSQHVNKVTGVNPLSRQNTPNGTRTRISADNSFGQKDMGKGFKEWVTRGDTGQGIRDEAGTRGDISYLSLVVANSLSSRSESKSFRYPWEAFSDVGFRCALSLGNEH